MKMMKLICAFVAVCIVIPVTVVGGANIVPWNTYDEFDLYYPEMSIDHYTWSNRVLWTASSFKSMYGRLSSTSYISTGITESDTLRGYDFGIWDNYGIVVSNVDVSDGKLSFDYTASIDLAPDAEGKTTYHALIVLFYRTAATAESINRRGGLFNYGVDGYQIVKYVAPGTVGGQEMLAEGGRITATLPENFDLTKHIVGCGVWRIENKPIRMETDWYAPYIAEPKTISSPVILINFSDCMPETEPPVTEPDPEPGTEGDKVYGSFTETGWYGWDENHTLVYPVTKRFVESKDSESLWDWYNTEYRGLHGNEQFEYMSRLWYYNYVIGDPEVWPQVYLDRFDNLLENSGTAYVADENSEKNGEPNCYVEYASINGNKLTIRAGGVFGVNCLLERITEYENISLNTTISTITVDVAIRDKVTGDLVHLAEAFTLMSSLPEYLTELILPDFYDPEKHCIEIYFHETPWDYNFAAMYEDPAFINKCEIPAEGFGEPGEPTPIPKPPVVEPKPPVIEPEPDPEPPVVKPLYGDANSDGVVNLSDVTLMMQYIAGWDVLLDEQTSDRSRNGRVDLEDVSYALKFIAGWNV